MKVYIMVRERAKKRTVGSARFSRESRVKLKKRLRQAGGPWLMTAATFCGGSSELLLARVSSLARRRSVRAIETRLEAAEVRQVHVAVVIEVSIDQAAFGR